MHTNLLLSLYMCIYIYIYIHIHRERRERERERDIERERGRDGDTHMNTDKASATDRTLLEGARVHGGNNNLVGLTRTR